MTHTTLDQYLHRQEQSDQQDLPAKYTALRSIADSCRTISAQVRKGALADVLGSLATQNVQGETQQKLDVLANEILLNENQSKGSLAGMASEEMEAPHDIPPCFQKGPCLLLFDPLDGSSNIDVNVSIGTIFSLLLAPSGALQRNIHEQDFLQAGTQQIAAGYALYGPQTMLVLTLGNGVSAFTLDDESGQWILTQAELRIPEHSSEFAINMSNRRHWQAPVRRYIDECLQGDTGPLSKNYNMRWIASMVADVHRVLMRGGVFMYPADARKSSKDGKLRLMYEANPMSFLVEQAGGMAINGTGRILETQPQALHQRTSVLMGSRHEIERLQTYHAEALA